MDVLEVDYYQRLKNDYLSHRSLFVAYDYDNTIFDYHGKGIITDKIVDLLKICPKLNFTLILFTGNEGEKLEAMKQNLRSRKIHYDFINENPLKNTRKPYYNILLDDRAVLIESY